MSEADDDKYKECPKCQNSFIESFGGGIPGRQTFWWMGCKRCGNHVKARAKEGALLKWRKYVDKELFYRWQSDMLNDQPVQCQHGTTNFICPVCNPFIEHPE